jgi:translation initiation factor 1 (eIF-1/SUI1)
MQVNPVSSPYYTSATKKPESSAVTTTPPKQNMDIVDVSELAKSINPVKPIITIKSMMEHHIKNNFYGYDNYADFVLNEYGHDPIPGVIYAPPGELAMYADPTVPHSVSPRSTDPRFDTKGLGENPTKEAKIEYYASNGKYREAVEVTISLREEDPEKFAEIAKKLHKQVANAGDIESSFDINYLCHQLQGTYVEYLRDKGFNALNWGGHMDTNIHVDLEIYEAGYYESLKIFESIEDTLHIQLTLAKKARDDKSLSEEERAAFMEKHANEFIKMVEAEGTVVSDIDTYSLRTRAEWGRDEMSVLDLGYENALKELDNRLNTEQSKTSPEKPVPDVDLHKEFQLLFHKTYRDGGLSELERMEWQKKIEEQYMNYLMDTGHSEEKAESYRGILKSMASGENEYTELTDAILAKDYETALSLPNTEGYYV